MISAREAKELTLKNAEVDIKDELAEIEKGILESVEAKKVLYFMHKRVK